MQRNTSAFGRVVACIGVLLLTSCLAMVAWAPTASAKTVVWQTSGGGESAYGIRAPIVDGCRTTNELLGVFQDQMGVWNVMYARFWTDSCTHEMGAGNGQVRATSVDVHGALATLHVIGTVPLTDGSTVTVDSTFTRTGPLTTYASHSTLVLPGEYVGITTSTGLAGDGEWTGTFVATGTISKARVMTVDVVVG